MKQSNNTPMETQGGGGVVPTRSRPRALDGVSGQRHAPAALCRRERTPVPIVQEAG
jgi:hypothetical protein